MLELDEDALICDLAETYTIFNYMELSPALVATLSLGLRNDSRIKMKMSNSKLSLRDTLLAVIADYLQIIALRDPKEIKKNYHSLLEQISKDTENKDQPKTFKTVEEYERWHRSKMR